jgi:hypothetical protein
MGSKYRSYAWLAKNARLISLTGGTAVVALWTILRHINNGVNYDVVGQIGVAQQWAHGLMSDVQLGTTSYLLKVPVYILVNAFHFLSPMNRLLLLAIIFNVVTFLLIFFLYEKIMKLYRVESYSWLYLMMGWLAAITGNVFWADYANSRNLEAVGGILFIYLTLKFMEAKRSQTLGLLVICGSIVFFSDPLQFYVCGIGACLFVIGHLALHRTHRNLLEAAGVLGATTAGYIGSQVLHLLANRFLHVTFLTEPYTHPPLTLSNLTETLHSVGDSTLKIFGADFLTRPHDASSLREVLNVILLSSILFIYIKLRPQKLRQKAYGLVAVVIVVNYLVYIASGQALQPATSRYLIMVPLLAVLSIALLSDEITNKFSLRLPHAWSAIIVASSVMLLGALLISWPNRHSKDIHIYKATTFMQQGGFAYALSSREIGVTTTYFAQGKTTILPMACSPAHKIYFTNLFYDSAAFNALHTYFREVPVIVPPDGIKYLTNCSVSDVYDQFGTPKRKIFIPDVGTALIYDTKSLGILH